VSAAQPGNPAARIEAAFRAIARTRMSGIPIVNEALAVEAVGFAPWEAHWLGILITPWCMNLMLLPREPHAWPSVPPGDTVSYRFPAGAYDFVSAHEPAVGEYQMCSLFSPMFEFADHAAARLTAEAALAALFDAANADHAYAPPPGPRTPAPSDARLSRRDLLRGRFAGRDDRG
jgi:[NiFe] hydrogenase assembly HybE family chaperone